MTAKPTRTPHGFYFDAASLANTTATDLDIAFGRSDEDLFDGDDVDTDTADLVELLGACAAYSPDDDGDVFASVTEKTRAVRHFAVAE